jgi:hypothetical protein
MMKCREARSSLAGKEFVPELEKSGSMSYNLSLACSIGESYDSGVR